MPRIPLSQAKPGMVLAREVRDARGFELMRTGSTLDAAILERLAQRGVAAIVVEGGDAVEAPQGDAEGLHRSMFEPHAGNPLMERIGASALPILRARVARRQA
ncbi:MAG: hypothetical protein HY608_05775 [Planctomycetes bacterium]|nr:hypothetical protein [Planctomycetota bacterium]